MSSRELLSQAKKLSPKQREKLIEALLAMNPAPPQNGRRKPKRVKWPDIVERAKRVTGGRMLPNPVLLERETYQF